MASEFDIAQRAAGIYAQSLLELAEQAGKAEPIGEQLRDLQTLWRTEPAFAEMMSSAAIDDDARGESLKKAFGGGRVDPLVLNLLLVLNHHRRSMILPLVGEAYARRLDEMLGRRKAFVMSAVPLSDSQRDLLRSRLKRLTGVEAILVEQVEPDLLGGIRVQVADRLYDMTVRRRLRDLRKQLLASVTEHLRGGDGRFIAEG